MKLTNEKRDQMTAQIIERMFKEREQKHLQKGREIAEKCLLVAFDHEAAAACPEGFLPECQTVNVYLPSSHSFHVSMEKPFRVPYKMQSKYGSFSVPLEKLSKSLEKEVSDYIYKNKDEKAAKENARIDIKSILYSVNTTNQLKELWPDVFNYVTIELDEKKPNNQLAPLVSKYTTQLKAS